MVGFLNNTTVKQEEEKQSPTSLNNNHNKDPSFVTPELDDFCSSFLDLDSLSDWMNDIPVVPAMDSLFPNLEITIPGETSIEEQLANVQLVDSSGTNGIGNSIPDVGLVNQVELADTTGTNGISNDDIGSVEIEKKESETDSSSSSSEEDDDDSDEVEEGEISDVEKMVAWSDNDFDEDVGVSEGPIRSQNEITDLPPVPPIDVTLLPHHYTLPVGVISSIIDMRVIVEGVEQHNPVNEGTIFWITESRSPLGIVDEIFGPVKSPYYIIRYNSENEVPEGIKQGTAISFVPEFANHVLKDELYKKGYDASGDNDEEISDEYEFSDDEKEAEFRKLQKMKNKRRTNESNNGNELKENNFKNRGGGSARKSRFSRNCGVSAQNGGGSAHHGGVSLQNNHFRKNGGISIQNDSGYSQSGGGSVENNHFPNNGGDNLQNNQFMGNPHAPSGGPSTVATNFSGVVPNCGNALGFIPNFPQTGTAPGFCPPPNIRMMNGMPSQQNMMFPNVVMWPQQNMFPNRTPFPQQFALPPNAVSPEPQPNFFRALGPWTGPFNQNCSNQQVGVAMQLNVNGRPCPPTPGNTQMPRELNQGIHAFGQNETNQQIGVAMQMNVNSQQRPPIPGNTQMPQEFSQGSGPFGQNGSNQQVGVAMPMNMNGRQFLHTSGNTDMPREFNQGFYQGVGHGEGSNHRGSGWFGGGRGRHQPK